MELATISIEVRWWVRPFIFTCVILKWFGHPIDLDGRMGRIVSRGIVPVIR